MFTELSNLILETYKFTSNKYIGSTNKCNVYWSFPHFEDQVKSRYFNYSTEDLKEKIFRALKEFNILRIFKSN
jgi:hypothetical protein